MEIQYILLLTCLLVLPFFIIPLIIIFFGAKSDKYTAASNDAFNTGLRALYVNLKKVSQNHDRLVLRLNLKPNEHGYPKKASSDPAMGMPQMQISSDNSLFGTVIAIIFMILLGLALFFFQTIYTFKWLHIFDAHMLTPIAWCALFVGLIFGAVGMVIFIGGSEVILFCEYGIIKQLKQPFRKGVKLQSFVYGDITIITSKYVLATESTSGYWQFRIEFKNGSTLKLRTPFGNKMKNLLALWLQNTVCQPLTSSATAASAPDAA